MGASASGDLLFIPHGLGLSPSLHQSAMASITDEGLRAAFGDLQLMVGSEMISQADDYSGVVLVGTTPTLPDDMAPLIVVDASGRVRETYKLWEQHRGNLERLPSAGNSFQELGVHLWKRASGRDQLRDPATLNEISAAIAELFERDPNGEWLILTYKDAVEDLKASVERSSPSSMHPKLHWLHWGKHRSTNDFKNVENVIIVGQFNYRQNDYLGLTLAASGLPLVAKALPDTTAMKLGEYKHNLLQAVCRASVRKASQGVARACSAFVVSRQGNVERVIEEVFPGCSVIPWKDDEPPAGRVADAIAYLRSQLIEGEATEVTKASIRAALGIRSAPDLSQNILRTVPFRHFLADNFLEMTRTTIRRAVSQFDEVEDGF